LTTYDTVWTTFLNKCKMSDLDLPQLPGKIHDTIQGAILSFNNRLRDNLAGDNTAETLNRELVGDELLILAHYIRISILENQLIYFTNTWQPFQKDIGLKNFSAQLKTLESLVEREENLIDSIILNAQEDYL
jgi:hypothetical protein